MRPLPPPSPTPHYHVTKGLITVVPLPVHHLRLSIKTYKAYQKQKTQFEMTDQASETYRGGMLGVTRPEISINYD